MRKGETGLSNNVKAFTNFNTYKKSVMFRVDPVGARVILELLPLLIHINHPNLPGYVGQDNCPCGIHRMPWPAKTLKDLPSFLSSKISLGKIQDYLPTKREIEGLFTIGSVGSLAQTRESDYDIWVVVDAGRIEPARLKALERKLKLLRRWITGKYVIDLHFFLMDVKNIRDNNFGSISQEGSGSALKTILKEEFYRTMTLIEGKIPLWWIVSPEAGPGAYEAAGMTPGAIPGVDGDDVIDLGDIDSIPEQELLGAALWQMHKALDDPLKSVLKMALVATYLDDAGRSSLLCNVIRKNIFDEKNDGIIDPYVEILRRVEDFYHARGDNKTVDLLRKCFYLKVNPNIRLSDLLKVDRNDKASMMVDIVRAWGWSLRTIKDLNEFPEWGVEKYRGFGDDIHAYLKLATVLLIRKARAFLVNIALDEDVEVEILRRRIEAFYVSKDGKIECEKRVKKKEPAYRDLFFSYTDKKWRISERSTDKAESPFIMESDRVVRILAWLVYNKRFDVSTAFHMIPNTSTVGLSDIQSLLWDLNALIPDANSIGLERSSLMENKNSKQMVIIANMECPDSMHAIQEIDVLWINSWNELFCIHLRPDQVGSWMARMKEPSTQVNIWLPREGNTKYLAQVLRTIIS
ncbi:MAG: class I adenylate cyclase [Syntrophaceae bacterium]|nr:class I adenylate cyclase [Deltaproteobacteria bacterium]